MEIIIKDSQLDDELQELYLLSKHWISDIDFVEGEVRFLKGALHKYMDYAENLPLQEATGFEKILLVQDIAAEHLKNKVSAFLVFVEPLINDSKQKIRVDLIEKFTELETEIKSLVDYVKLVKNLVFSFIEEAIRSGKYPDASVLSRPEVK